MKDYTMSIICSLLLISMVLFSAVYAPAILGANTGTDYSPFINDHDLRILINAV